MLITLVGHAGMIVDTSAGRLVIDPWMFGEAFNNSWNLLEPSYCPDDLWQTTKFIWFSHEHPDHFHPASIRSIPEDRRPHITVLFQETRDKRVKHFLEQQGFKVIELAHGAFFSLGGQCRVYLEIVGIYDSWILVEDGNQRFLDLNDCAVPDVCLRKIRSRFKQIDVLVSQFSFAGWIGNREDREAHRSVKKWYLSKFERQLDIIKPAAAIPAASFVRFSHKDNSWMNAHRNTVADAVERVMQQKVQPVVLRPGDEWTVGAPHDNAAALHHYASLSARSEDELHDHDSCSLQEIHAGAKQYALRLHARNNGLLLRVLRRFLGFARPISFWVRDLERAVRIDPLTGETHDLGDSPSLGAITIHSYCLKQLLVQPSGIDTLIVSGLFESADGTVVPLHNAFNLNSLNNAGIELKLRQILSPDVIRRMYRVALPWLTWIREAGGRKNNAGTGISS